MKIDADRLIQEINTQRTPTTNPMAYKWYSKQGYAQWRVAVALEKERKRTLSIIEKMAKG